MPYACERGATGLVRRLPPPRRGPCPGQATERDPAKGPQSRGRATAARSTPARGRPARAPAGGGADARRGRAGRPVGAAPANGGGGAAPRRRHPPPLLPLGDLPASVARHTHSSRPPLLVFRPTPQTRTPARQRLSSSALRAMRPLCRRPSPAVARAPRLPAAAVACPLALPPVRRR